MSDTPITDEAEVKFQAWTLYVKQYGHLPEAMEQAPEEADPFAIARKLERHIASIQSDFCCGNDSNCRQGCECQCHKLTAELAAVTLAHKAAEDRAIVAESRLSDEMALSRKLAAELLAATGQRDQLKLELERVNNEFGGQTFEWPDAWKRVSNLKSSNRELGSALTAVQAERDALRYALLKARSHLRAIGHRPETCYASSVIDAAIAASEEKP